MAHLSWPHEGRQFTRRIAGLGVRSGIVSGGGPLTDASIERMRDAKGSHRKRAMPTPTSKSQLSMTEAVWRPIPNADCCMV